MTTHSSNRAWKIPWTEDPSGPQSMGLQRIRHNWVTKHKHTTVGGPLIGDESAGLCD